jgi:hypothetical protein
MESKVKYFSFLPKLASALVQFIPRPSWNEKPGESECMTNRSFMASNIDITKTFSSALSHMEAVSNHGRIIEKRSKLLTAFLAEHNLAEPKSVKYQPLLGCEIEQCFRNVERQVEVAGGRMETGWAFFEEIEVSIHTVAHAIWITPRGDRMDITPWRCSSQKRILFLPDACVAAKRGYTAGWSTVFAQEPLIRSMAQFNRGLDHLFEQVHGPVGTPFFIPESKFMELAERVGLPWQFAKVLVDLRLENNGL